MFPLKLINVRPLYPQYPHYVVVVVWLLLSTLQRLANQRLMGGIKAAFRN